jgi:hypothetical protein
MKQQRERFVVICDSQYTPSTTLYLVDRRISKVRWWTNRLEDALILDNEIDANTIVNKLLYNNARVRKL